MSLPSCSARSESRFSAHVEALGDALGYADRVAPVRRYCAGLLLPGDRKSIEPISARVEPGRVQPPGIGDGATTIAEADGAGLGT